MNAFGMRIRPVTAACAGLVLLGGTLVVSGQPSSPELLFPSSNAVNVSTSPTLQVKVSEPGNGNLTVKLYGRLAQNPGPDFMIVALPDSQYYSATEDGGFAAMFSAQTDWIVSHQAASNIAYVAHLGDIVDHGDTNAGPSNLTEWRNATNALYRLENPVTTGLSNGIPYGAAVGNHDQSPNGAANGTTQFYNQFFGVSHFTGRAYYGGHYGTNNDNHFDLFSASGLDFIAVYFEYDVNANPAVLSWGNSLLQIYSNRHAIVVSHYIGSATTPSTFRAQGAAIYNALRTNANLFLMCAGHISGEGSRADIFNGNIVETLVSDYQSYANGGSGFMRLMQFSPSNSVIRVSTYSPWLGQFETDVDSQFTVQYWMPPAVPAPGTNFTALGTNTSVPYGSSTSLAWPGLLPNHTYEWYVTATDASNRTATSPTWRFTTALPGASLVWQGTSASPNWDAGLSTNWLKAGLLSPYVDGDDVLFDDTTACFSPKLAAIVQPGSVTVNASNNYTFGGSGGINGTTGVTKSGNGTLLVNNSNYFTGPIIINAGILRLRNAGALGGSSASFIYATNNGTLDLNHMNAGSKTIAIAGAGYNGSGALLDSATSITPSYEVANLTLVGDATIGSSGRWDNASGGRGSVAGNGFTLTKVGSGQAWLAYVGETGLGDIHVVAGTLGFGHSVTMGDPTKTVTVESGAKVTLWGNPGMMNKIMVLNNNATVNAGLTAPESNPNFAGPVTLVGTNTLTTASAGLPFWNTFSGTGGFIKTGTSNLWLHGTNTYSGPTILNPSSGTLLVDTNSSLGSSSLIQIGSGTKLDVSAPAAFNLGSGQTLCGNGTVIGGNINFGAGSTLAAGLPGYTVYTLTMNGNLTLQSGSTNLVKVNKTTSVANDEVAGLASVSLGGTLFISNLGNALTNGDAISLFSAGTCSGSFNSIIPAVPGAGLGWDASTLNINGKLWVIIAVNPTPTNITTQVSGNQLTLSWPADHTGWQLQVQTNTLAVGLSTNWVNVAGASATNRVIVPIDHAKGTVFYRLILSR